MTYFEQLHPWCIARTLPNNERLIVARFRRYNEAIAHRQVLQRSIKNIDFAIIFTTETAQSLPKI